MSQTLQGKAALVTGGGTGIGEGIARALARAGARVAITGRRHEVLEQTVERIAEDGGQALAIQGDVARPEDAVRMVGETVEAFGGLHILVNNAGVARGGPLSGMSDEDVNAVVDIDLKGPIYMTRAALDPLKKHREDGGSAVINISSSVTQTVLNNYSVYSAAKAGLDQLTRCWALELAPDRIRVNAICPGIVETPIFGTVMPEAAAQRFLKSAAKVVPLGRTGQPADIAELTLHLVAGSEWMTGAIITLDGGISLAGNV